MSREFQEPEHLRKLFIGGLDYSTTDDSLRAYFEQFGEVVDVVVMKDSHTKRSRGFGFVAFSKSTMVDETQSSRPHKIDGRSVDTKRVVPKDEVGKPESGVQVKKIFVGGIKNDVEEDDIREAFSSYGDISNIILPLEKETRKLRGFAFVEFEDFDTVDKICLHKNVMLKGKRVDVKKALSKDQMQQGGGSNQGGNNAWGGNQGGGNWGGNQGSSNWGGNQGGQNQGGWGGNQGGGPPNQGGWGGNQGGGNWGGNQGGGNWGGNQGGANQGGWGGPNQSGPSQGGWGGNQGGPTQPWGGNQGGANQGGNWGGNQGGPNQGGNPQWGGNQGGNPQWGGNQAAAGNQWGGNQGGGNQGGGWGGNQGGGWGGNQGGAQPGNNFGNNYGQSKGAAPMKNQGFGGNRSAPYNAPNNRGGFGGGNVKNERY
ncbi:unnamed protein product [Meganyctiphanes norvegica]|uniref:RRM domain-containing protein n=1 Tax=Meganyctiphanes norvegica TaxID=48144 RepID=A0AAV2PKH4_MEGNR